jgi:hypothetical protein
MVSGRADTIWPAPNGNLSLQLLLAPATGRPQEISFLFVAHVFRVCVCVSILCNNVVVHDSNPSYAVDGGKKIVAQGDLGVKARPYLKNKLKQKGWRHSLSTRP